MFNLNRLYLLLSTQFMEREPKTLKAVSMEEYASIDCLENSHLLNPVIIRSMHVAVTTMDSDDVIWILDE